MWRERVRTCPKEQGESMHQGSHEEAFALRAIGFAMQEQGIAQAASVHQDTTINGISFSLQVLSDVMILLYIWPQFD